MDLTLSMSGDLKTVTQLGLNLTKVLTDLTENHQIAFGSYVDKTEMPFYLMDKENYANPCRLNDETCDPGYLFKHRLNFTNEIDTFIAEVKKSRVSANVENLEGGFDALMQILLCHEEIGWSRDARKVVLLVTESTMHTAGDGLLLGAVERNPGICLINSNGSYVTPLKHDYPSVEEIYRQLKKRKINVIVAAKENSLDWYKSLNRLIPKATFVARLEDDSTNIIQLVREGYYEFMKRTTLYLNTSQIEGLQADFFADCYGTGVFKKTDTCDNVEEGKPIKYRLQFTLNRYQERESVSPFTSRTPGICLFF